MKCPTCEDAKENCCCWCGCAIDEADRELAPDPFADEIRHDSRLHLQCNGCKRLSAREV